MNTSDSGEARFSQLSPASSGASQHGACNPESSWSRGRRPIGPACRDLVAGLTGFDVLEEQSEPSRLGLNFGQVGRGHTGRQARRHFTVKANLDLVGA